MPPEQRVLIQTAFADETRAVVRAAEDLKRCDGFLQLRICDQPCILLESGIGPLAAGRTFGRLLNVIEPPATVLTIGLGGALNPELHIGQRLLIRRVFSATADRPSLAADLQLLSSNLTSQVGVSDLVTLSQAALTPAHKQRLRHQCPANVCDMESYEIANLCQQQRIPWIGLRIISDSACESIAPWILQLPGLVASQRWARLARLVATHPQDLPSLVRLAVRMRKLGRTLTKTIQEVVTHLHVPAA